MKINELLEAKASKTDWTIDELITAIRASQKAHEEYDDWHPVEISKDTVMIEVQEGSSVATALKTPLKRFISKTFYDNKVRNVGEHQYYFYLNRELTGEELAKAKAEFDE